MDKFLIFLNGKDTVAININDVDFGIIVHSLIKQNFLISPIQVIAGNSFLAIKKYEKSFALNASLELKEVKHPIVI